MKQKNILNALIAIIIIMLVSIIFTGCTSNEKILNDRANVKIERFSHQETFELPARYISTLSFTIQNKGNAIAENITLHINVKDNDGNEIYNKEITENSSLGLDEEKSQSINVLYDLDDTNLNVNISIIWNGGINHYNTSFKPEYKLYSDVVLEGITHYESYNYSYGYTTSVTLLIQNRGNLNANNIKIHTIINNNSGHEDYNKEEDVMPILLPWEIKTHEIKVPFNSDDKQLNLSIIIIWDDGINHYNMSFKPEYKEYADVKINSMTHYEHYRLFFGYVSTLTFILQNKGSETADNVRVHVIAHDNDGNEEYNTELIAITSLSPGGTTSYEIEVPFNFNDKLLNLSITVSWDGGSNSYSESYEPKIFF